MSHTWTDNLTGIVLVLASLVVTGCGSVGTPSRPDSEAANASYPAVATTRYARALGYMDAGDDQRAASELENLRAKYPEYSGPSVNLGIIHQRNGRPDAAMAAFEQAANVCATCAIAHNQLGIAQRKQGRFAEAEKSYLRAIDADSGYKLAYFNLGVLHDLYTGKPDQALRYYRLYTEYESVPELKKSVEKWIIDLERRLGVAQRTAKADE